LEYREAVKRPEVPRHIIVKPDPRPYKPIDQIKVSEGGAGWAFILAAALAIGWAATKRYADRDSWTGAE